MPKKKKNEPQQKLKWKETLDRPMGSVIFGDYVIFHISKNITISGAIVKTPEDNKSDCWVVTAEDGKLFYIKDYKFMEVILDLNHEDVLKDKGLADGLFINKKLGENT